MYVSVLYPLQRSRSTGNCTRWEVFVMFASSNSGLLSLTCCSAINTFCWWYACIYSASQQFIRDPFWHAFSSWNVSSVIPYSCLFSHICAAYADVEFLVLMHLICSLYHIFIALPECPTYALLHILHFSLYIPLGLLQIHFYESCCINCTEGDF